LEEAVEAGDRPNSWSVRPVYAVVRVRQQPLWPASLVYLPAGSVCDSAGHLTSATAEETFARALKRSRFLAF